MIHLLFLKKGELNMDTPQQLLHNFQDIISDDTTGLANLIVAIKGLNTYFEQAKRKNADKTYQIIAFLSLFSFSSFLVFTKVSIEK